MNQCFCPMCEGDAVPLGALGTTMHYRCRDCGWQWSEADLDESEDDEDGADDEPDIDEAQEWEDFNPDC